MFNYRVVLFASLLFWISLFHHGNSIKKQLNLFKRNGKWRDLEQKVNNKKKQETKTLSNAYQDLANYLKRYDRDEELQSYEVDEIKSVVESLGSSQAALKSMDGLTHQLKNTFTKSTSLQSRYDNFIKKKSRNTKEAAKIREYISTVERTLQATEILQDVSNIQNNRRQEMLENIDLQEIYRFPVSYNKLHSLVSICIPKQTENQSTPVELRRYYPNEVIISVIDDVKSEHISIAQLLRLMTFEKPERIFLDDSHSLFVQPSFLELSFQILEKLNEIMIRNHSSSLTTFLSISNSTDDQNISMFPIHRIRVLGHSSGAAVGSYLSMLLDGSLKPQEYIEERYSDKNQSMFSMPSDNSSIPFNISSPSFSSLIGKFNGRVRAYLLGCPPCISRSIVPKYITTIINGDDIVARTQSSSLHAFQRRVVKGLETGIEKKSEGVAAIGSLLGDYGSDDDEDNDN